MCLRSYWQCLVVSLPVTVIHVFPYNSIQTSFWTHSNRKQTRCLPKNHLISKSHKTISDTHVTHFPGMKIVATKGLPILFLETNSCILHQMRSCSFLWQLGSCFKSQPVGKGQFVSDLDFRFDEPIGSISKTNSVFVSWEAIIYTVSAQRSDRKWCDKIDFMLRVSLTWSQETSPEEWQSLLLHCRTKSALRPLLTSASLWNPQALADPYATFQDNLYLSWFLNLKITAHRQKLIWKTLIKIHRWNIGWKWCMITGMLLIITDTLGVCSD